MTTGRELVRTNANRKGWAAIGAGALTTAAVAAAISLQVPFLAASCAILGGAWTGRKLYEWLRYRGEWGIKF